MSREPISKPECRDRPVCCAGASVGTPAKWVLHRVRWPTESNHDRCHSSSKGHHLGLAVIAKQSVLQPGVLAELTAYLALILADSAASVRMMRTQSDTLKKHETDDDDLKKCTLFKWNVHDKPLVTQSVKRYISVKQVYGSIQLCNYN